MTGLPIQFQIKNSRFTTSLHRREFSISENLQLLSSQASDPTPSNNKTLDTPAEKQNEQDISQTNKSYPKIKFDFKKRVFEDTVNGTDYVSKKSASWREIAAIRLRLESALITPEMKEEEEKLIIRRIIYQYYKVDDYIDIPSPLDDSCYYTNSYPQTFKETAKQISKRITSKLAYSKIKEPETFKSLLKEFINPISITQDLDQLLLELKEKIELYRSSENFISDLTNKKKFNKRRKGIK